MDLFHVSFLKLPIHVKYMNPRSKFDSEIQSKVLLWANFPFSTSFYVSAQLF